jgi:cytidylate kinase
VSIIAISRGTFSGGEALAKRLADRLGFQCLSREANLDAAAKQYEIPLEKLGAAMERRPSFWERMLGQRAAYLTFVQAALCEQARAGNLVYHGHVGHLLLPGISHVMAVRVIAGLDFRARVAMPQQGLASLEEARAYIERVDRERRDWTRFLFGIDWDTPTLYDLVVNLSRMSLETACDAVARLAGRPEFQPTSSSLKALEDLALKTRVAAALRKDLRTRDANLDVSAGDGVVTLSGATRSVEMQRAAPEVARGVEGVKAVRSKIDLIPELLSA